MMQLRTLIFTSILLPWIRSSTAKEYVEVRKSTVKASFVNKPVEEMHNISELGRSFYKELSFLQTDTVNFPDYDTLRDSDTDPAAAPRADEMPTCLLCVCLSGSVYCEEVSPEMSAIPALPKETAHLYARFNKITKIRNKDFADMALKTIDLTGNLIAEIEDGAFSKLSDLEELILAENKLTKLPILPNKLVSFNANFNHLKTQGVKATAFKKLTRLAYLYLGNNELTAVPQLPESLHAVHLHNNNISTVTDETFCKGNSHYIRTNMDELRLDGNPVVLSKHPNSFICLQSLPIGWYN
ncbi:osteoglycin, paralog b isoform X1 [Perca flavescens]|uniref:osteoglycin, paralog b isoform X1 n=1 Tax=Perca flavescens TaxID=8167 RepID=UPI00106EFB2C|nr:mimecan-like isoform X1 [Perca flavescens]